MFVGDDGDQAVGERQTNLLADEGRITRVVRVNGDGGVAEHGLGSRGRNDDELPHLAFDRIFEVPQMAFDLDVLDLEVGHRSLEPRIPIDQPLVLVDEALAVEFDEDLEHRTRQPLVHRETFARPVAGGAQAAQLLHDCAAIFVLPLPYSIEKLLAPHGNPALLALGQIALDDELRRNAGMVRAGLPEHILAAHPFEAGQHVLQSVIEGMADMQAPRHVGWRDDHAECRGAEPSTRAKGTGCFPFRINAAFDLFGIEILVEHERSLSDGGNQWFVPSNRLEALSSRG